MAEELPKITVHWYTLPRPLPFPSAPPPLPSHSPQLQENNPDHHRLDKSRAQRILWLLEELQLPYEIEFYHRTPLEAPASLRKVHPLGKSPVITILPADAPEGTEPLVLAESGFITTYLCSHFAGRASAPGTASLVPQKWKDGKEGQVGGETEAWLRWEYIMHYSEGTFFPLIVFKLLLDMLTSPKVPFFVRPLSGLVAGKLISAYVYPNARKNLEFLEGMLADAPGGGEKGYLCGEELTAADILMSFALIGAKDRFADAGAWEGGSEGEFPKLWAYLERLEGAEGYKKSVKKVEEIDGKFDKISKF